MKQDRNRKLDYDYDLTIGAHLIKRKILLFALIFVTAVDLKMNDSKPRKISMFKKQKRIFYQKKIILVKSYEINKLGKKFTDSLTPELFV